MSIEAIAKPCVYGVASYWTLAENQFCDFFAPNDADAATLNALMTAEVLNANDITLVSQRPMTYRYHN